MPRNNPIENLHMQFCRQILGVQKNTTTHGVLVELGRTPLMLEAQRLSLKNWERIKYEKGNILLCQSHQNACTKNLDWYQKIKDLLSNHGMQYRLTDPSQKIQPTRSSAEQMICSIKKRSLKSKIQNQN